MYHFKWV